ncbi:MAG: Na+/H+ antiporter subunit E [Betaproteobacteria bacterium]|nr:Na+/H+ antiporter subunit E [Betaproteobacteria bacterium]
MRTWLPYSLLTACLTVVWLLLTQTLAAAHWLLGFWIAVAAALGYASLRPPRTPVRRLRVVLGLAFVVTADIVRSNLAVARIVIHARTRGRSAGFLDIPLELRSPAGLATLACIVTATPGTAWAGYDSSSGVLTLHILDLIDESEWIAVIKERYECRLLEIFP